MPPLKLIFAGTPAFSAQHLKALIDSAGPESHEIAGARETAGAHECARPFELVAVYTQPDRAAGRGKKPRPGPVKLMAEAHGLPVHQPPSLKDPEAQAALAALDADLMVVVAYGLILPKAVLDIPRRGCINVHASLLPRWRGAAPIERALLAGDRETGITIMQMDVGLDTGDMLYKLTTPINTTDTREDLEQRLAELGCQGLLHTLARLESLQANAEPQDDSLSTYAAKLEKHEAQIDWQRDAASIQRQIRAGVGRLPAWSTLGEHRIRLLSASVEPAANTATPGTPGIPGTILEADNNGLLIACGDGAIRLHSLQMPGKNPVAVRDALNARRELFSPGARFSNAVSTTT